MAYGAMLGGSVSLYDLMSQAEDIQRGNIGVYLATSEGLPLATQEGEAVLSTHSLHGEGSACANELYALLANLIRGTAAAPLLTAEGKQLFINEHIPLAAVRNL